MEAAPQQSTCAKAFNESQITKEQKLYKKTGNPLFNLTKASKDLVDFKSIKDEHFTEAIKFYNEKALNKVKHIKKLPANFHNTIEGFDNIKMELGYLLAIFNTLNPTSKSDLEIKINETFSLFKKIESIYKDKNLRKSLSLEQIHLLEKIYEDFKGIHALNPSQQKIFTKADKELSNLKASFEDYISKEQLKYKIFIDKRKDLEGVPEDTIKVMKQLAIDDGKPDKWLITLDNYETYSDIMMYAENRDLRKHVYESALAFSDKAKYDNSKILAKQIKLKNQIASLYGDSSNFSYFLKGGISNTPEKVFDFLHLINPLLSNYLRSLKSFSNVEDFEQSDIPFYNKIYVQERFELNKDLQAYFHYNNVLSGMFKVINKMFGLTFKDITKKNKHSQYHEDVTIYAVYDQGTHIGTLYIDPYKRKEKRSDEGGSVLGILNSGTFNGEIIKPQVLLSTNISNPLLDMHDVQLLFHEFGHALHLLLSNSKYNLNTSEKIGWDVQEFPSIFMQKLALHPEVLPLYAKHAKTGKAISQDLINKIQQGQFDNNLFEALNTIDIAFSNMQVETLNPKNLETVVEFENDYTHKETKDYEYTFANWIHFGLSEYTYLWSEAMALDVYAKFDEKGVFDKNLNNKLKKFLQAGSSKPAEDLYMDLMGRPVDLNHFKKSIKQYLSLQSYNHR